jgi:predicted AAA+ superfamily ATPase
LATLKTHGRNVVTDEELKELVASLAIDSKNLHEAQRKTDEQMRETNETLKRMGIDFGNMKKNQGDVAEEFFFNSLLDDPHLGSVHFDDIAKNEFKHRGNLQEEYDIVMTNGNAIGIVEVKYKAHENDLKKLERKMRNFKTLFPVYAGYKLYGAIASFHFYDKAKEEALNQGFFVLQRSGEIVHTDAAENLLVL